MVRGERSLEFFNGQLLLITRKDASEQFKFLSPAAVTAAFRNAPVDSGWLPPEVIRCGGSVHGDFAAMFIPAQVHHLEIEALTGKRMLTVAVPLPSLVFFGIGKDFRVWAIKDSQFRSAAQLFHCPTPNVFDNGGICWGGNQTPRVTASTIAKVWATFIGSPFSGHAANGKTRSHKTDVRGLLFELAGKKKFPAKQLVVAGRGTIDQAVRRAIGDDNGN